MISLILAAGKGTRMKSEKPKVLHEVNGMPMLKRVLKVMENIGTENNIFILGHKKDEVLKVMGDIEYVEQKEQLGTGHAVLMAKDKLEKCKDDVLITYGDAPLLKEETLNKMKEQFYTKNLDCILLSCKVSVPFGYGRIIKKDGNVVNVIEEKEADEEEKKINEVNTGVYIFKYDSLMEVIGKINNNNLKGEYYLTDTIKILSDMGYKLESYQIEDEEEVLGVNSKAQLAQASKILRNRKNNYLMDNGVIIIDPDTTYIEEQVVIGEDTVIYPNIIIQGNTEIGRNCKIFGNTRIENSVIADNVKIESSLIEQSNLEEGVTVGPFAHLRPKTYLKKNVHVGNFVEIKNSVLEEGVKAGHLTYLGDSEVGRDTNIGAGTITCNYDGKKKHKTIIGEKAFIGSNSTIVAPVEIGEKAFTAAGSTITKKVPEKALAFGRARQTNKEGWDK
ncbi:bifunctional UDP-N-acetylglucosamine diphosphorylase/glucosamine-1-phosphate N-acetyltransferase GlmU [Leptotrichia sp. OH3620_COT-345]|uniref:bifunctional UDP-N-acetylglucosamine diphosphorylase/glucosamine-1-phosphate N-acetyltransferase GlmU n=1 Tax=Leptotrichia sp. OH3620_COT-345 TaxID=2491048 RepID=UPI000F6464CD|nr:bifunctional UDP-N-acetylglucosamine diphosphorylase/glucosamine-1-phosphate N-acetyltransferase GlmU [Leptotrichia sp. OH3620_COT-345]RRD37943.1 bifunctional UDP-N-acetylglucosamine diphosphorylase/glucosamine-1-phosphate N-acetyltransferase GlmU [Leptotrichia sp. OH3620_COT-345]